jgi:DNA-binding NarL/FixJ family response regulator
MASMNNKNIKIAIADDQLIFRQGLENLLNGFKDVSVVLVAENGLDLCNKLKATKPDIALLDFRMPYLNGLETTKKIRATNSAIRILILSMYDDSEFVESAIESGANGYLSKDDDPSEIERAIQSVMETGYYLNDRTSKRLIAKLMQQGMMQPRFNVPNSNFSEIELEILKMICAEYTTSEIAERLCRSKRTIDGFRTLMMQKVGARNVVGLVMYAVKNELL